MSFDLQQFIQRGSDSFKNMRFLLCFADMREDYDNGQLLEKWMWVFQ